MADYLSIPGKVVRSAPKVRVTSPVLARYLDDLRFAEQARELDRFYGRIPPEPGPFDNINLPEPHDPVAAERAVGAAPRTWLESAEMARSLEPQPAPPLTDMLLDNERRRALLANRLDRLTPEQRARSLPAVSQQYDADRAAARAAQIKRDADARTAGALTAAAGVGAAAFAARVAQEREASRKARDANAAMGVDSAVSDIGINTDADVYVPDGYVGASVQDVPDLFADDTYLPQPAGVDEIALMDQMDEAVAAVRPPNLDRRTVQRDYLASDPMMRMRVSGEKQNLPVSAKDMAARSAPVTVPGMELAGNQAYRNFRKSQGLSFDSLFADDTQTYLEPDSPDQAIAHAPGPGIQIGRNTDIEDLPGPQLRSVRALIQAGIPAGRAMDIITKGASMSPDEYRMVTGGRR